MRRQIFGDYVLSLIRHVNVTETDKNIDWVIQRGLPVLASLAYTQDDTLEPPLSEKSRTLFRNRLSSAFAHLISDPRCQSYPCELLQTLKPSAVDMDEEISAAKDRALTIMEKLMKKAKKATENEKPSLQSLALLYALVIFQLYNGEADAISLLEELKVCYDKLIRGKDASGSESEASVVLVEILMSFMSKSSMLLRKIAQQVFTAFSAEITKEGLDILCDVLASSENLKGQQELFDQENEGDEQDEEDDDEDDDELDSDVEIVEVNGANRDADSGEEEDEDDDNVSDNDDEDGNADEDDDETKKLNAALAKALGTHLADDNSKDEASDSDADMTDSEMMALDSKLVEIFTARKSLSNQKTQKKEKKDARETIINFKTRVLDLLEIYVKEQPGNPLSFTLLVPILKLIQSTTAKQVAERAQKVLTVFAKASKSFKGEVEIDVKERLQVLKDIHAAPNQRDASGAFTKAVSQASLLVASSLYRADKETVKKITKVYCDTQVAWLSGGLRIQTAFFHDWVNWCQSHVQAA